MEDKKKKNENENVEPERKEVKSEPEKKEKKEATKEQIEKLTAEVNEYKDKWMRSVAEFDNYKKRNADTYSRAYNEGISDTILKILSVGDNLDWALTLGLEEKTAEGIRKTREKFTETLKGMGVEEINPTGEIFNPEIAEAVMQVPAEEGETADTVKMVLQKGYKLKEKIIRYAKVSVIK